jgi:ABC-2 type transport system permease protein
MKPLASTLFLARKDVRFLFRMRETWLWAFFMPIVFFYFIGSITKNYGGGPDTKDPIIVSVPADAGFLAQRLTKMLVARNYQVVEKGSRVKLEIPPGFTASVLIGKPVVLKLTRVGEGMNADYDQARIGRVVYTLLADLIVAEKSTSPVTLQAIEKVANEPRMLQLDVKPAGKRLDPPSGFEQAVPGTMVMFTMLAMFTVGASLLTIEREKGILRRLASSPMPRAAVVAAKWAARMTLGMTQICFAMLTGTVLFNVHWGSHLGAVMLVMFAYAGLTASLGILLSNFTNNQRQVIGVGVLASNVMAALGGCWWPVEITPPWAQSLAMFVPTGWAMDALHKLVNFGAEPAAVIPHIVGMFAASLIAGAVVARKFRFQ